MSEILMVIQWGSENRTGPDFEWCLDFEWSGFGMVGTIAVIGVYSTLDHSKTRPLEIQLQNVQIPKDSGFQTVGFGSPLNYSRINQKLFFSRFAN